MKNVITMEKSKATYLLLFLNKQKYKSENKHKIKKKNT
jgi:hypothetical protein